MSTLQTSMSSFVRRLLWLSGGDSGASPALLSGSKRTREEENLPSPSSALCVPCAEDADGARGDANKRARLSEDGTSAPRGNEPPTTTPPPFRPDARFSPPSPPPTPRTALLKEAVRTGGAASNLIRMVPVDVLGGDILSYLTTSEDRFSLQATCRGFRVVTEGKEFLRRLDLGGGLDEEDLALPKLKVDGMETSDTDDEGPEGTDEGRLAAEGGLASKNPLRKYRRGIILEEDTSDSALRKLEKFRRAENLQAMYMTGMIRAYCRPDPSRGVQDLIRASDRGCARSSYALGLILRDDDRARSDRYHALAAQAGHLPAWQELLGGPAFKAKFGDVTAERLRACLDFSCLNRLLNRHYVGGECAIAHGAQTSHCWNPLCGRWAYKQISPPPAMARGAVLFDDARWNLAANAGPRPAWGGAGAGGGNNRLTVQRGQNGNVVLRGNGPALRAFQHQVHQLAQQHRAHHMAQGVDPQGDGALRQPGREPVIHHAAAAVIGQMVAHPQDNLAREIPVEGMAEVIAPVIAAMRANRPPRAERAPAGADVLETPRVRAPVVPGADPPPPPPPGQQQQRNTAQQSASQAQAQPLRVSRMKMCSSCRRAKYCSKLCQVYDWRSGRHKVECQHL
eukprot:CAMPEP_0183309784 /NCGR_PEP_ID=MMETSP0160_2-20130417/25539_1 /TAXON_ID=2839 ORGANISM="Odontella Sinensis, Strain Grunow 1884" /NCGR_SAMPLE_ID=MMETSP0160_2 /ASSEMBLY_ACC=CAM_ASM_000250 /LENGTH=623 /DNA_ID=CAMNT_0025473859 /DNA_START=26 /DNA_END=1897 /DNA_ORIENTATION=+